MSNWDYIKQKESQLDQMARARGYVPETEARRLDEEQIALEDERNTVKRKDEAAARALNIVAGKVEDTGKLRKELVDAGLAKEGVKFVQKIGERFLSSPEEQELLKQGRPAEPTEEELARLSEAASHLTEERARETSKRPSGSGSPETGEEAVAKVDDL